MNCLDSSESFLDTILQVYNDRIVYGSIDDDFTIDKRIKMKKIKDVFDKFWWILAIFELLAIPWTIREYIHLTHRLHIAKKFIMSDTIQAIGLFLFTGIIFLILFFLIKSLLNVIKNKQKTKDNKTADISISFDDISKKQENKLIEDYFPGEWEKYLYFSGVVPPKQRCLKFTMAFTIKTENNALK